MAYGTTAGVAALTPRYANGSGDFDATTRPTAAQVTTFLSQVSNLLDSIMSEYGFDVPVTDAEVVEILTLFTQDEVAAIAEGINGSGRFGPTTKGPGQSRFQLITEDVQAFVESNATGMERMGASRTQQVNILYRNTDEAGLNPTPIFGRRDYGESYTDRT